MSRNDPPVSTPTQLGQSLSTSAQSETERNYHYIDVAKLGQDDGAVIASDKNLWRYIRDEMEMQIPNNARVREQRAKYLKGKSYLYDIAKKAEPYLYWIVSEVKQRQMPMELVLLPIVESAFNPHATSSANAAGIWQIIASTARSYGLKQNKWYDGRRDFVASTKTALDMMQSLNKIFDGDWLLTIAAYNSGEGRVLRAIKQNKLQRKATNFWSLSLPRETSNYVPKMLALSDILKNSRRYGLTLPMPDKSRALTRVNVGYQMPLAQAAKITNLPLATIKNYNSGYLRGTTAPDGPHYIMVPKAQLNALYSALMAKEDDIVNKSSLAHIDIGAHTHTLTPILSANHGNQYAAINQHRPDALPHRIRLNNRKGSQLRLSNNTYRLNTGNYIKGTAKPHELNLADVTGWDSQLSKERFLKPDSASLRSKHRDEPTG